jgi:L-serine dehydratase
MKTISILNDVLGPVMHGPSSSHTAGPYHIGLLVRSLLNDDPAAATFTFDPDGSFVQVYRQQGSDNGFAAGLLRIPMTSDRFWQALQLANEQGIAIDFTTHPLEHADHPNTVDIRLTGKQGNTLELTAKSIGGGALVVDRINQWPVKLSGNAYDLIAIVSPEAESEVTALSNKDDKAIGSIDRYQDHDLVRLQIARKSAFDPNCLTAIQSTKGVQHMWTAVPIFYVIRGTPQFASASEMIALAARRNCTLGEIGRVYESCLLDISENEITAEMLKRHEIMNASIIQGLQENPPQMSLLAPSAGNIIQAESAGKLAIGGLHTRAAARAMAVMHTTGGRGVICAAPTGGSAGVLPAVLMTLAETLSLNPEQIALALMAGSTIGLITAIRSTFAAEVAGCQVEIGVAGAMAAAAVVEAAGGQASQAVDAAAIALQNTMGSICDPVQGQVEIPCHTRNAVAASSALVCADLILGGYRNPIPLDETIDAMHAVGKMLPRELKCTALGGLSQAPSALKMRPQGK